MRNIKSVELKRGGKKTPGIARKRHRNEFVKRFALGVIAFAFLSGLVLYELYRPEVNITKVEVIGANVLKPSDIEEAVKSEISGKYFYLVPKRSVFFYPKKGIEAFLKKEFKRIETLDITRAGFEKLVVRLSERGERYLWCGRDLVEERTLDDGCYFVDSGGYVFSRAPYYSGNLFLELYGPLVEGENANPVGGSVLSENSFDKIITFARGLSEFGFVPIKILAKIDGDYDISLLGGGKILVSNKNDLEKNTEYLKSALATDSLKTKISENRDKLDYLDLRFGNKVFFKFK